MEATINIPVKCSFCNNGNYTYSDQDAPLSEKEIGKPVLESADRSFGKVILHMPKSRFPKTSLEDWVDDQSCQRCDRKMLVEIGTPNKSLITYMDEIKTLHLNLIRKWFDMIASGEKAEEYRDMSVYWKDRADTHSMWKDFDTITFSNGYEKNRDQIVVELKQVAIRTGKKEWGAEEDKLYYVFELGEVIKINSKAA